MNEGNKIVGVYVRVSTDNQSRFGYSLDEQEDRPKNYVNLKIMKYVKYIVKKVYQQKILCPKCHKIMD